MNYKSFVDVLFILLLGTIVMLAHSITIGAVDTELLRLGGGGVSPVRADEVEVVVIDDDRLLHDGTPFLDTGSLAAGLAEHDVVLLVVTDVDIPYQRVITVWSELARHGVDVRLGAEPNEPEAGS